MQNPRTHSAHYPESYYHHTLSDVKGFPQANGHQRTQVCVVGGGFSGVNTALELAERGVAVILLEAYRIGWGASGRNGGQLIRGIGHDIEQFTPSIGAHGVEELHNMGFEAVNIVCDRITKYDIQCDLKMGYCDLATKPRHLRAFEADKRWLDERGYPHQTRLLTRNEIEEVVGSRHNDSPRRVLTSIRGLA